MDPRKPLLSEMDLAQTEQTISVLRKHVDSLEPKYLIQWTKESSIFLERFFGRSSVPFYAFENLTRAHEELIREHSDTGFESDLADVIIDNYVTYWNSLLTPIESKLSVEKKISGMNNKTVMSFDEFSNDRQRDDVSDKKLEHSKLQSAINAQVRVRLLNEHRNNLTHQSLHEGLRNLNTLMINWYGIQSRNQVSFERLLNSYEASLAVDHFKNPNETYYKRTLKEIDRVISDLEKKAKLEEKQAQIAAQFMSENERKYVIKQSESNVEKKIKWYDFHALSVWIPIAMTVSIAGLGGGYQVGKDMGTASLERQNNKLIIQVERLQDTINKKNDTISMLNNQIVTLRQKKAP